jgi:hypothetical protein
MPFRFHKVGHAVSQFGVVPLSDNIGTAAYRLLKTYAKSHCLHVFDSLVAATAIEKGLVLITLNRKRYRMIAGLELEVPVYWATIVHVSRADALTFRWSSGVVAMIADYQPDRAAQLPGLD